MNQVVHALKPRKRKSRAKTPKQGEPQARKWRAMRYFWRVSFPDSFESGVALVEAISGEWRVFAASLRRPSMVDRRSSPWDADWEIIASGEALDGDAAKWRAEAKGWWVAANFLETLQGEETYVSPMRWTVLT